jgi:hypothetical protein
MSHLRPEDIEDRNNQSTAIAALDRPNIGPPDSQLITEGSFLRDRLRIHGSANGHSPLSTVRSA